MSRRSRPWPALGTIACALIAACGQAAHDERLTPVGGDGIGSFGASSSIELCRGSERVVPASADAAPAAVCVPEPATATACSSDAECRGIERCTCGRCVVRPCQDAAACAEDQVCRGKRCTRPCADDAGCDAGDVCVSGGCAKSCSSDAACHFGETCDSLDQVCVALLCSAAITCGGGDRCEPVEAIGDVREPEIVRVGEEQVAFVDIRETKGGMEGAAIFRVRIDAPQRWTADPMTPVLEVDDDGGARAPSALVEGAVVELFYQVGDGARIERARSEDGGRTFVRVDEPVLEPGPAWEAGRVASPSAFVLGGNRYLAYEGGVGAGVAIAALTTGGAERLGDTPVVGPATLEDPVFWRGVTKVGAPYAVVVTDVDGSEALRLYVTARGAEGLDAIDKDGPIAADRNDSIGLVVSRDLSRFDRFPNGPVFARITNLKAYLGEREPCVLVEPGQANITFVAADAAGEQQSGLARAGGAR